MANKSRNVRKEDKKSKAEHKRSKPQTEYQRERDAVKNRKKKNGMYGIGF